MQMQSCQLRQSWNDRIVAKYFLPGRVRSEVVASLDKVDLLGGAREKLVLLGS